MSCQAPCGPLKERHSPFLNQFMCHLFWRRSCWCRWPQKRVFLSTDVVFNKFGHISGKEVFTWFESSPLQEIWAGRKVDCMVHSSKWIRTQVFVTRSFLGDEWHASQSWRCHCSSQWWKILHELQSCSTSDEFSNLVQLKSDVIAGLGYSKVYTSEIRSKDEIVQCLLKQAFVFSVHAEVEQFWHGLNSVGGLWHLLRGSPKLFGTVLGDGRAKLNANVFKQLYNIVFSDQGSNQKDKDLEEVLIQELTLEDLLVFITRADAIPPLGFDYPLVIAFYDMDANSRRLPWSSTSSLTLNLPRGFEDAQQFNALISNALLNCYGFGKG